MKRFFKFALVAVLNTLVAISVGCDTSTVQNAGENDKRHPDDIRIAGLEFVPCKPDFGGEACVEMAMGIHGNTLDQDFVFDQSGVDPMEGRGCTTRELLGAIKTLRVDPGQVWIPVDPNDPEAQFMQQMNELKNDLQQNVPWIVCLKTDEGEKFMLVTGMNLKTNELLLHNPNVIEGAFSRVSLRQFAKSWQFTDETGKGVYIKFRMKGSPLEAAPATEFTNADYAQHIRKLKAKMPEGDFKIVIQKPFVVVGDEELETVKRRAENTVGWAVTKLKRSYFTKDPKYILDVWLFKDKTSYETNAKELFGRVPGTPYGYYSSYHRSLVMNISTGGGTLVHEIVHPFIENNFEDCPSWFNEGLASLYEQSTERNGGIWGSTNWRLRGLQLAIQDDRVPAFATLFSTTRDEFYDEDPGTNYAQGRYLCYYLQERGKLVEFYTTFRDNVGTDPTGIGSLRKVLGTNDLDRFKKQWEQYVLKLRF